MTLSQIVLSAASSVLLSACSPSSGNSSRDMQMGGVMGGDMPMMDRMPERMMSGEAMMSGAMMQDMRSIHGLLTNHEKVKRRVEDIPKGVRTVTTSDDPRVARLIRTHVRQMKARYERDQPIRLMDPVFRELFRNRGKASLTFEDIPGGIRVTHTSDDPQVVLLIRQHARRFVSEAAEQGMRRAMRPTPLPEGYRAATEEGKTAQGEAR